MLTDRIIGAFTFRSGVYKEVEEDTTFTTTAWLLVIVIGFLDQLGSAAQPNLIKWLGGAVVGTIFVAIGFAVGAFIINWVGRTVFNAEVTFDELVRTLGLAYVWNIVGVLGVLGAFSPALLCLVLPAAVDIDGRIARRRRRDVVAERRQARLVGVGLVGRPRLAPADLGQPAGQPAGRLRRGPVGDGVGGRRFAERIVGEQVRLGALRGLPHVLRDRLGAENPRVALHDPLTVATVVEPELCRFESRQISVDEEGRTERVSGGASVEVAVSVENEALREHLMEVWLR